MRFRAKILLSILIPASIPVTAAVAAALLEIQRSSDLAVRSEFERTLHAMEDILSAERVSLGQLEPTFGGPWFQQFVRKGQTLTGRAELRQDKDLEYQFQDLQLKPDYFAAATAVGEVWARQQGDHLCMNECRHPPEWPWAKGLKEALFRAGDACLLGRRITFEVQGKPVGAVVVAKDITEHLKRLRQSLQIQMALLRESEVIYLSILGWTPSLGLEGSLRLGGARYIAGRSWLGELGEMVLLRPMSEVDRQRTKTLVVGVAALGLAVLVAAGVSAFVSRGISRPVEVLVDATCRVGEGDYTAKVDIAGRDEMARLGGAFNDMTEGLRKRREIMEKTLSRDVAEELMKGVELGGERREVTVLFMDVRGFTPATEGVDPAEVVTMLNDMMNFLAEAIARHGGNVNKYLGDGLMAMFGAPKQLPDHAFSAVHAALEMQREMTAWNARRAGRGAPPLQIGFGINTGVVLGGKVGSKNRLEYTLIGEEVNLASRVCGKAAPGQILVTKRTRVDLGDRVRAKELEPIQVKGLSYPVQVYEVQP